MDLSNIKRPEGAHRDRKRVGRGPGSGLGKTSGRGQKGQKARAGGQIPPGFEGGQMPLHRRLPKRGFRNIFSKKVATLNVRDLEQFFEEGAIVDLAALTRRGLIPARIESTEDGDEVVLKVDAVKILGDGELTKALNVQANQFSAGARTKIEAAGGTAEVIER